MRADDEGFVGNPRKILRMIGASEDDIRILIMKRFILAFDSGIVVIKHWKIHNYIQNDRFKSTTYLEEKATLTLDGKKAYTECIHDVSKAEAQVRIGKDSIDKVSIDNNDEIGVSIKRENALLSSEFEEIWKLYPNKQGKEAARKHYIKARKNGESKEEIEDGIKRYSAYCKTKKLEKQYIKHGSTWFSNKSWQDDYELESANEETPRYASFDADDAFERALRRSYEDE